MYLLCMQERERHARAAAEAEERLNRTQAAAEAECARAAQELDAARSSTSAAAAAGLCCCSNPMLPPVQELMGTMKPELRRRAAALPAACRIVTLRCCQSTHWL